MKIFAPRMLILVLLLAPLVGNAQSERAAITGRVTDPTKAVIPEARIIVTNKDTNVAYEGTTNEVGSYTVTALLPGTYRVEVEKPGFRTIVQTGIVLHVQDTEELNYEMGVGSATESITVEGGVPLVNTQDAAVSTVVDRQFVENLPLNGRSFQTLIALVPGVLIVPASGTTNTAGQFSVNGQRSSANSFMVDGVSANFGAAPGNFGGVQSSGNLPGLTTFGTTQSLVSVDAMQEFRIQTSTYAAEFGRQPGGQVSIVTRSGTREFHGSAFEYLRNDALDANDWFANRSGQPKPAERQNDFGGTLGGPLPYVDKAKSFFFFSYEGLRLVQPQFNLTNVPTLALRQQATAAVQPLLNAFPLPNGKDLGNGLAELNIGYSDPSELNATSIRLDHIVSSKLTIFGRYNSAPSETDNRRAGNSLSVVQAGRLDAETLTVGATALLSRRVTNEFRANYSGNGSTQTLEPDHFNGAVPMARALLIPSQYDSTSAQGTINLTFAGETSTGFPQLALTSSTASQRQVNLVDNFQFAVGSHQLKTGIDYRRLMPIVDVNGYVISTQFASAAQVVAGTAGSGTVAAASGRRPVFINFSAYVQDTWRPVPRLTADFGVRWDVNPAPTESNLRATVAVTEINNLATMALAPLGTKSWSTTLNNFAPRVGLSFLLADAPGRETVVRGGFGVFYDIGTDAAGLNFNVRFPYVSTRTITNVTYPLSPAQIAPAPLPIDLGLPAPYPNFNVFDPNLKLPYTLEWNVSVERSLGEHQSLVVSYVSARGRRLLQERQVSISSINPRFTTINLNRNGASSDYQAVQIGFRRRLSRGLQAMASYTLAHAIDDASTGTTLVAPLRGNADYDVRHAFSLAATFEVPSPRLPVVERLFGHWGIDTSFYARSALPVDLVASTVVNPIDGSLISLRPNVVPGVAWYVDNSGAPGGRSVNKAAFVTASAGQTGNLGRNVLRGLAAWQQDAAIRRTIAAGERIKLQFRIEAFNVFNKPNFGAIQTNLTASNFGQATNMLGRQLGGLSALYQIGGPRSFQAAVKVQF